MAVVTRKTTAMTNSDAVPPVLNNPGVQHQFLRSQVGTLETVAGDSVNSVYAIARVPSNARIDSIRLFNDADASLAADVGIYPKGQTAAVASAIDADFFASAVAFSAASTVGVDVTHESGVFNIDDIEKPLWQALGLSSDPCTEYDIALTLTGAATGAATVTSKVSYVI